MSTNLTGPVARRTPHCPRRHHRRVRRCSRIGDDTSCHAYMAREPVYVSSGLRTVRGAVTEPKPLALSLAHARCIPVLAANVTGDAFKRSRGKEQSGGQGSRQTMAANDVIQRRVGGGQVDIEERLASCPRYLLSSYGFYTTAVIFFSLSLFDIS